MATAQTTKQKSETREGSAPSLIAFNVIERGEKKFWTRIGAAWKHEDGDGMTLQLDLVPTQGGRVILRAPREEDKE